MKPNIIILYKDKSYKITQENKLSKYMKDVNLIKYLLVQSLSDSLVYYPIIPDKRLLAGHFELKMQFDISSIDFDENTVQYIDTFTSNYKTDSLVQFVDYLSIFYKINGISELIESAFLADGYSIIRAIYPTYYHIHFGYGNYEDYDDIDSGELKRTQSLDLYEESVFNWLMNDRMSNLSDILLTPDSDKNSSHKLPILMEMSDDIWTKINKVNHLPELNINNEAMILLKINDFNSYYLTTYEFYKKMTHTPSLSFDIFITEIDKSIPGAIYNQFAHNIQSTNQMERDALCRYIKEEYAFYFGYTFTVGDAYYLISWIIYNKYIMTYLISLYKREEPDLLFVIRCLGKMINTTFTFDDVLKGKFTEYLYNYIIGGKGI